MSLRICLVQWLNKRRTQISAAIEKAPHLWHEKLNKRRGAYSSKYGNAKVLYDFIYMKVDNCNIGMDSPLLTEDVNAVKVL